MESLRIERRGGKLRLPARFGRSCGVTLFELLLTAALLTLFLGVVAFNFNVLGSGLQLDEGVARFETLLRFARAESANTGQRVRIEFDRGASRDESESGTLVDEPILDADLQLANIRVTWEPSPLVSPGEFRPVDASWAREDLNALIGVVAVGHLDPAAASVAPADEDFVEEGSSESAAGFLPITFYPDGSSDSAEVTFASKMTSDRRRIVVTLIGWTGTVTRREDARAVDEDLLDEPKDEPEDEPEDADDEEALDEPLAEVAEEPLESEPTTDGGDASPPPPSPESAPENTVAPASTSTADAPDDTYDTEEEEDEDEEGGAP